MTNNEDEPVKECFVTEILKKEQFICFQQHFLQKEYPQCATRKILSPYSESFHSSSGDVPLELAQLVWTELNQFIERPFREKVMGSKRSKVLRILKGNELPRSFLDLMKIYSDKMAIFLKWNALVAYPIHVMWLIFPAVRSRCLVNHT